MLILFSVDMKLMKGDEISLRYGSSWEGKGHVVKVPDSKLLFSTITLL